MRRVQVKSQSGNTVSSESTPITESHAGTAPRSLQREHTDTGKITQDEASSVLRYFVKADRTAYHLTHHQSLLHRDGTVSSQKACYFHEPFNVASKDIYIIYHSGASQKPLLHKACQKPCLFPVFFSPPTLKKKLQINLFLRAVWGGIQWPEPSHGGSISAVHTQAAPLATKWVFLFLHAGLFLFLRLSFLLILVTFSSRPVNISSQ